MPSAVELWKELARRYDDDPRNWRMLAGRDRQSFYDALVIHGDEAWQIKEYQVNPYKFVGVGSKVSGKIPNLFPPDSQQFGLRVISKKQVKELMKAEDNQQAVNFLLAKMLSEQSPVSSTEIRGNRTVLHGPIAFATSPLGTISPAQAQLDAELRTELQRMVKKQFRHTLTPYG